MGCLDIEQAARLSGLGAREVRLLIEEGRLPAERSRGRWLIDERHLAAVAGERPEVRGSRPIGADPPAQPEPAQPEPAGETMSELLARLESAAVQIADLRAERDDLRLKLREQVSSLQRSLEDSMEELDAARARVAELEAGRSREPAKDAGTSARAALTPLFRATTAPPRRGGDQPASPDSR